MKAPTELGADVKVDIQRLPKNDIAMAQLSQIGKMFTPIGKKHVASYAVHIYTQSSDLQQPSVDYITQLPDLPAMIGETIAQHSLKVLWANLMAKFGHRNRHTDKNVTGQENLG